MRTTARCLAVAMVLGLSFSEAVADGVFVWNEGVDLVAPSQIGVILHDEGTEELVLQVKYQGPARDFAWLVPLPAAPEVKAVKSDLFAELSQYTQRRERWVGHHGRAVEGEVQVLERKKVSIYDVAVLKAKGSAVLMAWLKENGYNLPKKATPVVADYVKRGWVFTAVRIHPDDQKLWDEKHPGGGTLVPLKFSFASDRIVYPLKISSLNAAETEVLLYVFGEDVVVHPDLEAQAPRAGEFYYCQLEVKENHEKLARERFQQHFDFEKRFFRAVGPGELPACKEVLPRLAKKRFFLSKLRNTYRTKEMTEDLLLVPPEKLDRADRKAFALRQPRPFENSLLLRVHDETVGLIGNVLTLPPEEQSRTFESEMQFLVQHPSEPARTQLLAATQHLDPRVRRSLAQVIAREPSPSSLPLLQRLSKDPDPEVNRCVCEALSRLGGDEAMVILVDMLDAALSCEPPPAGKAPPRRRRALGALAQFSDPKLIPVFRRAFKNAELTQDERHLCLRGLERIDDPSAYPLVEAILHAPNNCQRDIRLARSILAKWDAHRKK